MIGFSPRRSVILALMAMIGIGGLCAANEGSIAGALSAWAFPAGPPALETVSDDRVLAAQGSAKTYREKELRDHGLVVDWFPASHGPMPDAVKSAPKGFAYACGYCHLADGEGRPENAALAGLSEDYIERQIADIKSGARKPDAPGFHAGELMSQAVANLSEADARAAATYYSALSYVSRVKVVETVEAPAAVVQGSVYIFDASGPKAALGDRILEGPENLDGFKVRDPKTTYVAYVPMGSLAHGADISQGVTGKPACEACHGAGLTGTPMAPPIAGRSPTALYRALYAFRTGARNGDQAQLMTTEVADLSEKDLISIAAYVASLKP